MSKNTNPSNPSGKNRKQRSRKSRIGKNPRSRKGFKGTLQPIDFNLDQSNEPEPSSSNSSLSTPATLSISDGSNFPSSSTASNAAAAVPNQSTFSEKLSQKLSQEKTKVIYKSLKNKSAEKLRKSHLNKHKRLIRTRSQTQRHGVRKLYQKKRAAGFKLIDAEILMKVFNNFTVCKNCKTSSSIEIQEIENLRRGMCETLTMFCKSCSHTSEFKTSPRSSNKILAYDVNIRSV